MPDRVFTQLILSANQQQIPAKHSIKLGFTSVALVQLLSVQ